MIGSVIWLARALRKVFMICCKFCGGEIVIVGKVGPVIKSQCKSCNNFSSNSILREIEFDSSKENKVYEPLKVVEVVYSGIKKPLREPLKNIEVLYNGARPVNETNEHVATKTKRL